MVRVLHIAMGSGAFGGVARFCMNYYQYMNRDNVIFDFLFCNKNSLRLVEGDELLANSKIFELGILGEHNKLSNYLALIPAVRNVIKKEKYEIIHVDTGSLTIQICCLLAAKLENVKVRIAHSHSTDNNILDYTLKDQIKKLSKPLRQKITCYLATDYFACSYAAGIHLFGAKGVKAAKFKLMKNAINTSKFSYNENARNKIRNILNINRNTTVFGHIGRFDKVKNQSFLIDVYEEIYKLNPNSKLILVGDGPEIDDIKSKAKSAASNKTITFLGERNDVDCILQGLDAFIFPSYREGLSIVAIEAQCSGLPVFASDSISKEHDVTGNVKYLGLDLTAKKWAEIIIKYMQSFSRKNTTQKLIDSGYEIKDEAKKLELFYLSALK